MDNLGGQNYDGTLKISSAVIEKIARHAAMEVDGVRGFGGASREGQPLLSLLVPQKPVNVQISGDMADIELHILVDCGARIPALSEKVQKNVKDAVQGMTSVSVTRVDVVVAGLAVDGEAGYYDKT